jgi:uncharacterized protein (DUF58 family)
MRMPTRRGVFLLALGLPLGFAAIALNENVWVLSIIWFAASIFALAVDAFFTARLSAVEISVTPLPLLYIGETDPLEIRAQLIAKRRGFKLEIAAEFNERLAPIAPLSFQVAPTGSVTSILLRPLVRGMAELKTLIVRWAGPLGLMAAQHRIPLNMQMPIIPNTRAVARESARLEFNDAIIGLKQQRRKGQGGEFEALREFGQGSDRRHIDWKHSARHHKLLVKEFDTERNHNVVFAFDSGQLMGEPVGDLARLDHAINGSLMLARICMKSGDKLGLFSFNAQAGRYLAPSGGPQSFGVFAGQTAKIEQVPVETNYTLGLSELSNRLQRRSLIIVMTEFTDSTTAQLMIENLGRLAKKHLILFVCFKDDVLQGLKSEARKSTQDVARIVVADELARERRMVLEKLRRLGLLVLETEPKQFSFDVIQRYLDIKLRSLI